MNKTKQSKEQNMNRNIAKTGLIVLALLSVSVIGVVATETTWRHSGFEVWGYDINYTGYNITNVWLLDFKGNGTVPVSASGHARLYFDNASNKLKISENGGAYNTSLTNTSILNTSTVTVDRNANGSVELTAISTSLLSSNTTYLNNGTFNAATNRSRWGDNLVVTCWAGGGGGGASVNFNLGGGGGGSGAVVFARLPRYITYTVEVGKGGAGITGANGEQGGNTSFWNAQYKIGVYTEGGYGGIADDTGGKGGGNNSGLGGQPGGIGNMYFNLTYPMYTYISGSGGGLGGTKDASGGNMLGWTGGTISGGAAGFRGNGASDRTAGLGNNATNGTGAGGSGGSGNGNRGGWGGNGGCIVEW